MAKKKAKGPGRKELEARVAELEKQLEAADYDANRWRELIRDLAVALDEHIYEIASQVVEDRTPW